MWPSYLHPICEESVLRDDSIFNGWNEVTHCVELIAKLSCYTSIEEESHEEHVAITLM
jgi:hypothetical protein